MNPTQRLRKPPPGAPHLPLLLCAAVLGLLTLPAGQPLYGSEPAHLPVIDVALSPAGVFQGRVVDQAGHIAAETEIALLQKGRMLAGAASDANGHFQFESVRPGMYLVATPGSARVCRVWAANVAPPAATSDLLVVDDATVARGQRYRVGTIYEWVEAHPLIGYTALTAVIAVPIVIATQNDDDDAS